MSQIPHSQLALKKRSTPVVVLENDLNKAVKSVKNGASNGNHKSENGEKTNGGLDQSDKDIIILDDEYVSIPVGREETVEEQFVLTQQTDETTPMKKKRGRKPKSSTDSRESSEFSAPRKSEEMPKSNEVSPVKKDKGATVAEELPQIVAEESLPAPETKVLKLSTDLLPISSNQRRSDRLQNASTIVNLSTMSSPDQSLKITNDTTMTMETPSTERKVSGRRSTRPIDDIKFTYRSPDPDDSVANATIGSDIGESLLETPLTDRKRRMDSMENIDSPKRSRLDLSALFNNFYSPVTLLRDKFRRTNLASTPKAGGLLDESINSIDTSASEMKEIDLNEKSGEKNAVSDNDNKVEGGSGSVKFIVKPAKKTTCSIM